MTKEQIYLKDIYREIEGVIKASSRKDLKTEVKEYVITAEQMRAEKLPNLFSQLTPDGRPKCVWISGDFGSGKSHLLKILSYVLEDTEKIDGESCADIFADKAGDDFELCGDIRKACKVPTESVLFNIQEVLDGIAKGGIDPVLNIFVKEFNRKMGFDEKKPEIAEIERYFASRGKYEWLKSEYQSRYGKPWEEGRKSILLKQQELAALLAELDGTTPEVALQNVKTQISNYKLDTDGFALLVKEHLATRPQGARFIFFVDEVGQFIGKDVNRMLSLQTIAESLSEKTDGQCILMVTSQMDINAALGNLEKQQEYDFSRIQGRFTTRLNLTSANADEVIQRRLLEKKAEPERMLEEVYEENKHIIKSLFNFGEASQYRTSYKSAGQFAVDFPFVDYQFNLLQNAIIELAKNNAFSGKQQSVGERSMLTIIQKVAQKYPNDLTKIVPFSEMYEGLRGILQTKIANDILQAERTLDDELAVKVLKALFLVKYVKGFPSTSDNITKLLLPTLDTDFPAFKSEVQDALNKLVRLSYIEKGANDEFHFQTNEEKDIENEIKNEELTPDAINNELKKIFRDEIYSESKVKISDRKIFNFARFVDEQQDGRDADIAIQFITPNSIIGTEPDKMQTFSFAHPDQLCVALGEDKYLNEDIAMFKKADKCLTRLLAGGQGEYRQQIVSDKRAVNRKRRESIVERLTRLTKDARLYLAGQEITDIHSSDIKTRLNMGMAKVVERVYINLKMLQGEYDDQTLRNTINDTNSAGWAMTTIDPAAQEVFNYIFRQKTQSIRVKVKDLVDYFRRSPYGWYEQATLGMLVILYKKDKISFRANGNVIADRDLYNHLTNSNLQANLIVDVEEIITNGQIKKLKDTYKDLFDDETCMAQTAKDVHNAFIERLKVETDSLQQIKAQARFRFVAPLDKLIDDLRALSRLVYPALYSKLSQIEDAIDEKEDAESIVSFVNGPQFAIYRQIDKLCTGNNANLRYVSQEVMSELTDIYNDTKPWTKMPRAKELTVIIKTEVTARQNEERDKIIAHVDAKEEALKSMPTFAALGANEQSQIAQLFDAIRKNAREEHFIGNLIAMTGNIETAERNSINTINAFVEAKQREEERRREEAEKNTEKNGGDSMPPTPTPPAPKKIVNGQQALHVNFNKPMLENAEDVDAYVAALRTQLLEIVNDNNNILLS